MSPGMQRPEKLQKATRIPPEPGRNVPADSPAQGGPGQTLSCSSGGQHIVSFEPLNRW